MIAAIQNKIIRLCLIVKYSFKYRARIKNHIMRVRFFYSKLVAADMIPIADIDLVRLKYHDKDKLKVKNLVRQSFRYLPQPLSEREKWAIHNVVMEHIKSNKHHCEYWNDGDYASSGNDCTKMDSTYLFEMCADWAATAEENGGQPSSLFEWCDRVINKKFMFTDEQVAIVNRVCEYLSRYIDPCMKHKDDMTPVRLSSLGISTKC